MHTLKRDTKNKARPEGSICEAYLDSEVVNFCNMYFAEERENFVSRRTRRNSVRLDPRFEPAHKVFKKTGESFGPKSLRRTLSEEEYNQAFLYILFNCDEVDPFQSEFERIYCPNMDDHVQVQDLKREHFINWFRGAVYQDVFAADAHIQDLARGPSTQVQQFRGYKVNGFRFHTVTYGVTKGASNSGVCVRGETGTDDDATFYGKLQDVIQLDFGMNSVVLFKCKWYDTATRDGVWKHPAFGLVEINPKRIYPLAEPFILAEQAHQVYYSTIPGKRAGRPRRNWWAVYNTRARHVIEGLSDKQPENTETTALHNIDTGTRGIIFQDNSLPRLRSQTRTVEANQEPLALHTGAYRILDEPVNAVPAPPPTDADLFDRDMEIEEHESETESEN